MKNCKKILSVIILLTLITVSISTALQPSFAAPAPEQQILDSTYEWRYLDDNTDPNIGTWYERWNIRCGWTFPLTNTQMKFSDATWSDGVGPFSYDSENGGTVLRKTDEEGKTLPTYFFRATFNLPDPSAIKTIAGRIRYNDAAIIYINGKPIEQSFNIPNINYPENLTYGSGEKLTEEYAVASFVVDDVSMLAAGPNVLSVELHTNDPSDEDVYFLMESLVLNPSAETLPDVETVKTVSVNTGEDESKMNFAWYSLSNAVGKIQIAKAADMTDGTFPVASAKTFTASESKPAYTKFYDKSYYYNKAIVSNIQRGQDYVYRVGNNDAWSEVYTLSTKDISEGYEVLFISDAQVGTGTITTDKYGWNNTLEQATGRYPNFSMIMNAGDVVDLATRESEYDAYFSPEKLKQFPSAVTPGNHDVGVNFKNHFNQPNESLLGSNVAGGDYYFTYGKVLYMVLNTNNANYGQHIEFMRETIDNTKHQDFKWKIVMFHQSIYCAAEQSKGSAITNRRSALVPVFDELGIDVVLMGHDHSYTRTHHIKGLENMPMGEVDAEGYELNPEGTLYLTMSSASGSKYYDIVQEYEYSANQMQLYVPTFARLEITDDTFRMTAHRSDTMEVIDSYAMRKTAAEQEVTIGLPEQVVQNEEFTVDVRTPGNYGKLTVYNSNMMKMGIKILSKTTNADGSVDTRLSMSIGTPGENRAFTIHDGDKLIGQFSLNVSAVEKRVVSIAAPTSVVKNELFEITVVTKGDIKKLTLLNENFGKMGVQVVNKYGNADGSTTTVLNLAIGTAKNGRTISVYEGDVRYDAFTLDVLSA